MKHSILFGNGINNLSDRPISWNHLLNIIKGKRPFDNGTLPNTIIYERALFQNGTEPNIKQEEFKLKEMICQELASIESNDYYQRLSALGCDNYLTTNYDYALKNTFVNKGCFSYNKGTETTYSVRRFTQITDENDQELCRIWHLHGEVANPISIMLGYDQYCGSLGKIDGYVKGTYTFKENNKQIPIEKIEKKIKSNKYDNRSWVELFFNTHIHIIGLALDFSENDLWWILNKRARLMTDSATAAFVKNNIFFYTPDNIPAQLEETLISFKVQVVKTVHNNDWHKYYTKTIDTIKTKIS